MVVFGFLHAVLGGSSISSTGGIGNGLLSVFAGLGVASMVVVEREGSKGFLITTAGGRGFLGIPGQQAGSRVSFTGSIPLKQPNLRR